MTSLSGKRILVVEDEFLIGAMLTDILVGAGSTVVGPARTAAEGVALAASEALDGAVVDVNLRGENSERVWAELMTAECSVHSGNGLWRQPALWLCRGDDRGKAVYGRAPTARPRTRDSTSQDLTVSCDSCISIQPPHEGELTCAGEASGSAGNACVPGGVRSHRIYRVQPLQSIRRRAAARDCEARRLADECARSG